jgi:glycosyltransferase involved in cell wall biosynthesis
MPDVVLPVLDESRALPSVLAAMPPGYRPLVVDNGSSGGSGDLARRLGARVVVEPRRGFGAACFAGLGAATSDVVAFMDCDGSLDPRAFTAYAQRRRLAELGLRIAEAPVLRDVDSIADARAVAEQAPRSRFAQALERLTGAVGAGARDGSAERPAA